MAEALRSTDREQLADRVTAAREGCQHAFDDVMRATYDDTYRLALRLTGNHADASEVTQDTYVRAFRHLRLFRGDASVATWLYRITTNCASTLRSRQRRHRHSELAEALQFADPRPESDPEAVALDHDLERRLRSAITQLPSRLREVFVLREMHDLSHEEIAARLAISVSAAKVRLHRARRKLRGAVFDEPGPADDSRGDGGPRKGDDARTPDDPDISSDGVTMSGVTMSGVTMSGVTMSGVTMSGVTMSGVTMSGDSVVGDGGTRAA